MTKMFLIFVLLLVIANIVPCWSNTIYFTDGKTALQYELDAKRTVQSCARVPASFIDEVREIRDPNVVIHDVSEKEITMALRDCLNQNSDSAEDLTRMERNLLIYKGTKWCGVGNIADNDDDLGEMKISDACCRTHDKCRPYMKAWACKGDFCNTWPWSRFQCSCDNALFDCLKAASKTQEKSTANGLGSLYFDILGSKCYEYGTFKKCVKTGWLGFGCKKYKTTQGLHWVKQKKEFCPGENSC